MSNKLQELHSLLAEQLLNKIKDPDVKASDLNVARQFLKDNGIDAVPVNDNPLAKLVDELPFAEKKLVKNN
mgnify:CR=1|tara:strand:+ start:228 stop:440 length:213 start_codon:yes stop_codon:yes gene_type:complete